MGAGACARLAVLVGSGGKAGVSFRCCRHDPWADLMTGSCPPLVQSRRAASWRAGQHPFPVAAVCRSALGCSSVKWRSRWRWQRGTGGSEWRRRTGRGCRARCALGSSIKAGRLGAALPLRLAYSRRHKLHPASSRDPERRPRCACAAWGAGALQTLRRWGGYRALPVLRHLRSLRRERAGRPQSAAGGPAVGTAQRRRALAVAGARCALT